MYFDPIEFGKRLKKARLKKGLTQEAFAELIGVDRLHANRMEKGVRVCSIDLLVILSETLDVSTDYLLKGTPMLPAETRVRLLSAVTELSSILNQL